jgi:hypothetical protein
LPPIERHGHAGVHGRGERPEHARVPRGITERYSNQKSKRSPFRTMRSALAAACSSHRTNDGLALLETAPRCTSPEM